MTKQVFANPEQPSTDQGYLAQNLIATAFDFLILYTYFRFRLQQSIYRFI